jgi:hypothetical protein
VGAVGEEFDADVVADDLQADGADEFGIGAFL